MKLIQYLGICEEFDGELYIKNGAESKYGFVWMKDQVKFTVYGKQYFKQILDSAIIINKANNIELQDIEIPEDLYDLFMQTQSGDIGQSFYDKCLEELE